jgi:predicted ArsR family transcriptional regulator
VPEPPANADPVAAIALLDEPTRRLAYEFVADSGEPVSRDQTSAAIGVSRELAAFHLDRLVAGGLLEVEYRRLGARRGPGGGRPSKLYRRVAEDLAVTIPPRDYERLAIDLADALGHLKGPAAASAAADVAKTRGESDGQAVKRTAGRRPSRRHLDHVLVDHFRAAGYEPLLDERRGTIRLRNCPYRAIATSHRELTCGMNLAWAKGVVHAVGDPTLGAQLVSVPGECCVRFEHHR